MLVALRLRVRDCRQTGQALLAVLVVLVIVTGSAVSLVWFMNRQQTRAGAQYHSRAALYAAEAGVHRALGILETMAPDHLTPGRHWVTPGFDEAYQAGPLPGRYRLSVVAEPDGARLITSAGVVVGASRTIRVRTYLASPVLLAAVYGAGIIKIDQPPAAVYILPYNARAAARPWVHFMAGRAVWFEAADATLNRRAAALRVGPGPADPMAPPDERQLAAAMGGIRISLARGGIVSAGGADQTVDPIQMRAFGVPIDAVTRKDGGLPDPPAVDREYFSAVASSNTENASVNRAAGLFAGVADLAHKRDSLYSGAQFLNVVAYLVGERRAVALRGVIYVRGIVVLGDRQELTIRDGALIAESTVHVGPAASLTIEHSAVSRTLPGLITLDLGKVSLAPEASLRVHGLVYANRALEAAERATLDIVGAVVANDPGISFRATGATVVLRYDPAVLGTPGLVTADQSPVVTWIASWEESP